MTATLFGVGVGPGDPGLVTLRGARTIAAAPVVAYPVTGGGTSFARAIAAAHIRPEATELAIAIPMSRDPAPARAAYDTGAEHIAIHLAAGRDVAFLCEGDPLFYGTFAHLMARLGARFPVVIVPGVPALAAAAAAAARPHALGEAPLTVAPATGGDAALRRRLAGDEALALMKVGRRLPALKAFLAAEGRLDGALLVERASLPDGRCRPLAEAADGEASYFSMVLVPARAPAAVAAADGPAIVILGAAGRAVAGELAAALPGAAIHAPLEAPGTADERFADAAAHLRALFRDGRPIVGVCAAGILVRALAPLVTDKQREPPVVAVAADGSAVVPLLGGHHGANALARRAAAALGGVAAVTTAGDVALGFALDEPPPGWRMGNREAAKAIAAALLAGGGAGVRAEAADAPWLFAAHSGFHKDSNGKIVITDRSVCHPEGVFILYPPVLAVGVGCDRDAAPAAAVAHVRATLAAAGLAEAAVACVASVDVKMDEPAVHAVAAALGVPARFIPAAELETLTPRLANPSETVFRVLGCHGVSEAAALAASGAAGALVAPKRTAGSVTCAVARAPAPIDPETIGVARGRLDVLGAGPGAPDWRTPSAARALRMADAVVGYGPYLDLVADLIAGKPRHTSGMTREEDRVRAALDMAAAGGRVALVSSGDPGIYALATLAFELVDRGDRADWRRVEIAVHPGVSAMQAAAARAGAPLGHDFCAVSLSDLLTPWEVVERRLRAAAEGDFVVALYNPGSKRRRDHLVRARDILLGAREPETPVVVASNLGREGETTRVVPLGSLGPGDADMHTVLIVGSTATRRLELGGATRVYTPRGYAAKRDRD